MKKILFTPILLLVLFSCSPDEETPAPTNTVQTTTPETVVVQYTLTVTASEGGSVTDGGTFDDGTEVVITASPIDGYRFTGWEGNSSTNESLTVTLSSNQTLNALFELIPLNQFTLTILATEQGGTVYTDALVGENGEPYELLNTVSTLFEGTEISITATANEGYTFEGWEPIDDRGILYSQTISFTLNSDIILTPIFLENLQYTLTINVYDGGTVSSEDGTIDTSINNNNIISDNGTIKISETTYQAGTELILTASSDQGYGLQQWTNYSNNTYSEGSETISITLNSDTEIAVVFVNILDSREIIVKRIENQNICQNGGFSLLIGWDNRINISSTGIIDEIIQEINFCNISDDYLTFDNIVSEYSRIPEIIWKNNQLHLQNGLNSSNYKTPIVSYLGPNTNPVYSNDLIDYNNAMAFWYRFDKLNTFNSFKFNFQDRADAKNKILSTIPNYTTFGESDANALTQINCSNESCFGGANANVTSDKNGFTALRIKTPETDDLLYFSGAVQVHEFTHSIHLQWLSDAPFTFPCWLTEGTAHYSGLSIGLKTYTDYITERTRQMSGRTVAGLNPNNANDLINQFFNVYNYDSGCSFDGIYTLSYSVGLAVVEALSTISGPDSIMMVWNLGKYGYSFEESFELVYGISWNEAVPILAEVVSKYSY